MKQELRPLVLFSWGYWGWGSTTRQFVESVDLVEKSRGFNPPVFIDARLRRSVRAPGFRDSAFMQLLGEQRYCWMNGLGNKELDTGGMKLKDPTAVSELLRFADECAQNRRRVIYYCGCPIPHKCHRSLITKGLDHLAKKRKLNASVVEWPGTALPESPLCWKVSKKVLSTVEQGRKSFELPNDVTLTEAASVAWYTPVILTADDEHLPVLIGPAFVQKERWVVQVLESFGRDETARQLRREAMRHRKSNGYEYVGNAPALFNAGLDSSR